MSGSSRSHHSSVDASPRAGSTLSVATVDDRIDRAACFTADGALTEAGVCWPHLADVSHLRELVASGALACVETAFNQALEDGHGVAEGCVANGQATLRWSFERTSPDTIELMLTPVEPPLAIARAVCEHVAAGTALTDEAGRLVYINEAYGQIYGQPRATLIGRVFTDMLQVTDRETALAHHRAVIEHEPSDRAIEYEIARSDGELRIVEVQEERLELPNGRFRLATLIDVTEHRLNERELATTEARLRDLMDTLPGAIFQFRYNRQDGYSLDHVSEGIRHIIGCDDSIDLEDFDNWLGWVPEQAREAYLQGIEASRANLSDWVHEWPIDVPAGRVWLYGASRPHQEDDDNILWNGFVFDITGHKEAQQRLGQAETDYQHIFENTHEGIFRSTLDGHLLDANPSLLRMHRCSSREEMLASVEDLAKDWYVNPESRDEILQILDAHGYVENFQTQLKRVGTGEHFWASESAQAVYDTAGTVIAYQGTVRDISEQRRAEVFAARRGEILEMIARGEPLTQIVYEIVGTLEQYHPRLTAAVCQLQDGLVDIEAAPALANACIEAIHDKTPAEIGGAIAAAMRGQRARLDSDQSDMASATERLHEAMQASGYGDVMAFPVIDQDSAVLGILAVFVATTNDINDGVRNLLHEMAQIASIAFEQQQLLRKLIEQAQYDPLTQLPNRTLLTDRLSQAMLDAGRKELHVAVLLLDIDEFKLINDTLGHSAGDKLLVEIARRLEECLRAADTVARFGGDEFVAVVPLANISDATDVAERILARLQPRFRIKDRELAAHPSIGISLFPQDGLTTDNLIQAADTAMYTAKHAGKNQYRFFAESMNEQVAERLHIEAQLRDAIEQEQLVLYYQPRVNLPTGTCYGAEALLRWQHPERGLLGPGQFLPIAEQSALIGDIDHYVVAHAVRQIAIWQRAGHELLVSLNLSARLLNRDDFGDEIARLIDAAGVHPRGIEVEITESMVMQDFEHASRQLRELREKAPGLRVALDDFGSGYSSLQYLRELPIDTLKIDRSFVADLDTLDSSDTGLAIAKTIVELGQNLGMDVIAEGVETPEQAAILHSIDCHEAQGFWFAHPLPADEFLARLGDGPESAG